MQNWPPQPDTNGHANGHHNGSHGLPAAQPAEAVRVSDERMQGGPMGVGQGGMMGPPLEARPGRGDEGGRGLNFLDMAWRRRGLIIVCLVVAMAGAGAYLYNATPLYQSVSQVYIEREAPRIMGADDLSMSVTQGLEAQVQIMRSTALLDAAAKLPGMQVASFTGNPNLNAVGFLKSGLDVTPSKSGDMLFVSFSSPEPDDNAIIVNSVVEAYIDYHNLKRRSTAAEVLKILREEKQRLETELDETNAAMLKFKEESDTITFDDGGSNPDMVKLQGLSGELMRAELVLLNAKVHFDSAVAVRDEPEKLLALITESQLAGDPVALAVAGNPRLDAQIEELERELAIVRQKRGAQHPMVVPLVQQLGMLKDEQRAGDQTVGERYLSTLEARYRKARTTEQTLRSKHDEQLMIAMRQDVQSTKFAMLQIDSNRILRRLDLIDNRIKELNVTEDTGILTISVLEPAIASSSAVSPNRTQILGMGLMVGLMAGFGIAFLLELMDDRIRGADDLTDTLGLGVLGLVPRMAKAVTDKAGTVVADQPRSPVAEGYRTIRTALHFGTLRTGGRTILVTSPQPGDGKSTVASNMAIAFAQTGARTVLVDGDCRKPRQHKIHGVQCKTGLSSVLSEEVDLDEALMPTEVSSLDLLPCGKLPSNPAEMLNTPLFEQLLVELTDRYDRVIIDSPPVVAVSDARIIGALADATLLVIKADTSRRKVVEAALNGLESVGSRVVGAVVNAVSSSRGRYSGYSPYGYYSYGYESTPTHSGLLEAGLAVDVEADGPQRRVLEEAK